ncbi:Uncharacterized protein dnm_017040 [Desulfonema magnum]|uniref:Uncharacterized protein n=1 Tax=Desulfonema magnum TaxID=45655 RepID=A0A975BIH7_9BACT|nr:Uncharacterized protein dnm_017040 [Desulfonema magnum]
MHLPKNGHKGLRVLKLRRKSLIRPLCRLTYATAIRNRNYSVI